MAQRFVCPAVRLVAVALVSIATCTGESVWAEDLPRKGTFEGIYRQDRWGVSGFSFYLVAPELHAQLKPYSNKRIRLEVLEARQYVNPGDAIVHKIGKVTELDNSQVVPDLRVHAANSPGDNKLLDVELKFLVSNESDRSLDLSLQDVHVGIRRRDPRLPKDVRPTEFANYQMWQLKLESISTGTFNNHLSESIGSFENGHHVRIAPKEAFPIVVNCRLDVGEYEFSITGRPFASLKERGKLPSFARAFAVDIDREGSKSDENQQTELRLDQIQWKSAKNQWQRPCINLSFVVRSPPGRRSVVVCSDSDRAPLAGTLTALDTKGNRVKVYVDPCYDCSNLGEPWLLTQIPEKGIASSLNLSLENLGRPIEPPKQVRLQLLTDRRLESFDLRVPSADELASSK
jgi:hypothetical protein